MILLQALDVAGITAIGFDTWRPTVYAYLIWAVALGTGQVMMRGEAGKRALFVLPAALFTVAMAIFPTFFGLYIAFTDWNLSSFEESGSTASRTWWRCSMTRGIGTRSSTCCSTWPWCWWSMPSPSAWRCC